GYFLLLPSDYADLGRSAFSQQMMMSNVYFYQSTGYFDGPADLKPILHTWSLAVEEQFYLFFPCLLMYLKRFGKRQTFVILSLLAVGSFALSQYSVTHNSSAAFFLLPSRAWEMLLGGIICFLPEPQHVRRSVLEMCSWCSLGVIVVAAVLYTSSTPFPGTAALVPCMATALLIYCNSAGLTAPASLLASRPVVLVGLMSYSLYLWHWPVLAFSHYWFGIELGVVAGVAALGVGIVLGALSWKFVETPLRHKWKEVPPVRVVGAAVCSALLLVTTAHFIDAQGGLPNRIPEHVRMAAASGRSLQEFAVSTESIKQGQLPVLGTEVDENESPDFLVWGDSHAMALGDCFDNLARDHQLSGVIAARTATVPIPGVWRPGYRDHAAEALEWNQAVLDYVRESKVKNVVLVSRWAVNIEGRPDGSFETLIADEGAATTNIQTARSTLAKGLNRTLDELQTLGVRVWVLKQVPLQKNNPRFAVLRSLYSNADVVTGVTLAEHLARQKHANDIIDQQISRRRNVSSLDLSTAFFDADGHSLLGSTQGPYYRDDDHLSDVGAQEILRPLLAAITMEISQSATIDTGSLAMPAGEQPGDVAAKPDE
ncbi:MAG: acyltransferase, partial [Planctomycetaceae bacterium]|nr:acyltransferase [Planctomycetaceae bacterium]